MSKTLIITLLENGVADLEKTMRAVPDDKLNWKPLDNGRTILNLLGDAAQTPVMAVRLLEERETFDPYALYPQLMQECAAWTRDECLEKLRANTTAAIEAIRALSDEELEKPLQMPHMQDATLPLGAWLMLAYRTFVSRYGQINYIQTLYGDFEYH